MVVWSLSRAPAVILINRGDPEREVKVIIDLPEATYMEIVNR